MPWRPEGAGPSPPFWPRLPPRALLCIESCPCARSWCSPLPRGSSKPRVRSPGPSPTCTQPPRWPASRSASSGRHTWQTVAPGAPGLGARGRGYAPADTPVVVRPGEPTLVNLRLQPSPFELNPVVAIGYGEQAKGTLTGAVSAVAGKEVQSVPATNLSNTLGGRLPGLVTV